MKQLFASILLVLLFTNTACFNDNSEKKTGSRAVTITKEEGYYSVTLDYRSGISRKEMGAEYMKAILSINPGYESLSDSYLADMDDLSKVSTKFASYATLISRVPQIRPQIMSDYLDELDGMASCLSETSDIVGDGRLSANELFALLLFPDLGRGWACSGFSVFGSKSSTGKTVTGRNLDFLPGTSKQMATIHSIITIKYDDRSICMVGFLGNIAVITAFNNDGVFAGILDSPVNTTAIDCSGKNSYTLDIRYALENYNTAAGVADYMTDTSRQYTWNHNIILSDTATSVVVENNVTGTRVVRNPSSVLNPGITWGYTDAIAVVNSFIANGSFDNHTISASNTGRWDSFLTLLSASPAVLGVDDIKSIMGYHAGSVTSRHIYRGQEYAAANGNISMNLHSVIFTPETKELEVYFMPETGPLPDPVYKKIALNLE